MNNLLHSPKDYNEEGFLDHKRNILFSAFTQFIEHDLARPVVTSFDDGDKIECCNANNYVAAPRYQHQSCAPLEISDDDSYYNNKWVHCLNYVRSSLAAKCEFGPAEQVIISFILYFIHTLPKKLA